MRIRICLSVRDFESVAAVASDLCDAADDGFYIFVYRTKVKCLYEKQKKRRNNKFELHGIVVIFTLNSRFVYTQRHADTQASKQTK